MLFCLWVKAAIHKFPSANISHYTLQKNCNLNLKTSSEKLTPLHIAVHEGYSPMVEGLVGYGAELNEITSDGNTVLHLTISRKNMKALSETAPQLQKV